MNNRELKFRVWDISHKCFIDSEKYCWGEYFEKTKYGRYGEVGKLLLDFSGNIRVALYPSGNGDNSADSVFNPLPNPLNFVIQQYIGIKDKSKKEIFEGDIIKFKYFVGDFAWENLTETEAFAQCGMIGKHYTGVIQCNLTSVNLDIVCGNPNSTHMTFPLLYATHSKVIGNIFENPELLKNK